MITLVLKFCFTQIISNPNKISPKFTGIIKWVKIDNSMSSMFIAILNFIVTLGNLVVASIFNTKKRNIDIEIGRKNILLDILIEIFTKSTIKENIWITKNVETQILEGKSFVFVENKKDKVVSVIEKDGKFTMIKENGQKSIILKRIEIHDTKNL